MEGLKTTGHCVLRFAAIAGCFIFASCFWQGEQPAPKEKSKEETTPPQYIGTVEQVYPERNFALIRLVGPQQAPGTTLITHPLDGSHSRVGNLSVSSERLDSWCLVADIRGGTVVKGDVVYVYRPLQSPDARKQETEEEENEDPSEDVPLPESPDVLSGEDEGNASSEDEANGASEIALKPSVPAPIAPPTESPRKAPSSLDDIPDAIDDIY